MIMLSKVRFVLMKKTRFLIIILLVLVIGFLVGRLIEEDHWTGTYYPEGITSGSSIYSPKFDSKEECIGWAINERGLRPEDANVSLEDLWECNKNCRLSPSYNTLINASQQYKQKLLDDNRGPSYYCEDGGFDGQDWLRGDF